MGRARGVQLHRRLGRASYSQQDRGKSARRIRVVRAGRGDRCFTWNNRAGAGGITGGPAHRPRTHVPRETFIRRRLTLTPPRTARAPNVRRPRAQRPPPNPSVTGRPSQRRTPDQPGQFNIAAAWRTPLWAAGKRQAPPAHRDAGTPRRSKPIPRSAARGAEIVGDPLARTSGSLRGLTIHPRVKLIQAEKAMSIAGTTLHFWSAPPYLHG